MKFIKAIILAAIPWYPIGWVISKVTETNGLLPVVVTSIISIVIFFIAIRKFGSDKSGVDMVSNVFGTITDMKDAVEFNLEQKSADLYAQTEEEYNNGKINKGLWSQALIKAKSVEHLRKVEYMKLRAKQLKKNA